MINEFDYERLNKEWNEAKPFRHVVIDNFFDDETALKLAMDELYAEGAAPELLARYPVPRVGGVEHEVSKVTIEIAAIATTLA